MGFQNIYIEHMKRKKFKLALKPLNLIFSGPCKVQTSTKEKRPVDTDSTSQKTGLLTNGRQQNCVPVSNSNLSKYKLKPTCATG